MSAALAMDPRKNLEENKKVGYYVDKDQGLLMFDPMATLNGSFFDTSATFNVRRVEQGGLSRRAIQKQVEDNVQMERQLLKTKLGTLDGVLKWIEEPPVTEVPIHENIRAPNRSKNATGCIVSSPTYIATLEAEKDEKEQAEARKIAAQVSRMSKLFEQWGPLWRKAEEQLQTMSPSKLPVAQQKALILRKTGHGAKSKSNKEGAITEELRSVLLNENVLITPLKEPEDNEEVGSQNPDGNGSGKLIGSRCVERNLDAAFDEVKDTTKETAVQNPVTVPSGIGAADEVVLRVLRCLGEPQEVTAMKIVEDGVPKWLVTGPSGGWLHPHNNLMMGDKFDVIADNGALFELV